MIASLHHPLIHTPIDLAGNLSRQPGPPGHGGRWPAFRCWVLCALFLVTGHLHGVRAASPSGFTLPEPIAPAAAQSISGQFVVHGRPSPTTPRGVVPELGDQPLVTLHPDLLAISAERVKATVLRKFEAPDRWKGKIHLYLQPNRSSENQPIRIVPQLFRDGWYFWMVVPERMDWRRLVRALTEAILLEMANRSGTSFVETPLWLNEGLAGLILAENGRELVVEQSTAMRVERRREDPLRDARALLAGRDPLSFTDLGLPDPEKLRNPRNWELYQGSAILLTHELLSTRPHRAQMLAAIQHLPQHLNWQTSFLKAFSRDFVSLLEVEKWWAVNASHILARDAANLWTAERTLHQLDRILQQTVELPPTEETPNRRTSLHVIDLIRRTDAAVHVPLLQQKLLQLRLLYAHAPADILPLAVDWTETLERYVDSRTNPSRQSVGRGPTLIDSNRVVTRQTLQRMNQLNQRMTEVRRILGVKPGEAAGDVGDAG